MILWYLNSEQWLIVDGDVRNRLSSNLSFVCQFNITAHGLQYVDNTNACRIYGHMLENQFRPRTNSRCNHKKCCRRNVRWYVDIGRAKRASPGNSNAQIRFINDQRVTEADQHTFRMIAAGEWLGDSSFSLSIKAC